MTAYGEGSVYKRGARWWIRYPGLVDGKPKEIRESAGAGATEKDARAKLRKRLADVESAKDGLRGFIGPMARRLTVKEIVDDYIDLLDARRIKSLRSVIAHAKPLLAVLGSRRVLSIGDADISEYIAARRGQGRADGTIDRELEVLRGAFFRARKSGRIFSVPDIPTLVKRHANARQGFLEPGEFFALLSHVKNTDFRDLLEFFWWTAMRPGEIASLLWSEYDEKAQVIRLRAEDAKIGRSRTVPVVGPLVEIIKRRRDRGCIPYIFTIDGKRAVRLSGGLSRAMYSEWKRALLAAGLPPTLIPYDLRRSALRNTLKAGASERAAMQLGGWLTRSTMDRYNIVSESDLADAIRAAAERANPDVSRTKTEKGA